MTFAERLKALRAGRHLSQRELADKVGLPRSVISMYEGGKRNPKREALEALADFFNVDIDYLLGRSDQTTVLDPERLFVQTLMDEDGTMLRHYGELSESDKRFVRELIEKLRGGTS